MVLELRKQSMAVKEEQSLKVYYEEAVFNLCEQFFFLVFNFDGFVKSPKNAFYQFRL